MIRKIYILLLLSLSFGIDHLLITQVVTQPDAAESFSIYNPTDSPIDLTNYYICDDEDYFTMQTEGDLSPSHIASGFTAQFPDFNINSEDTLTIVLNSSYGDFYGSDFTPDLLLYGTETNSMLETETGSFGGASDKMNDNAEMIILFYWDGNPTSPIQDVDYFIWGSSQNAFDKSDLSGYQNDTPIGDQLYFEESADEYYAFSRIGIEESNELEMGGNGITGHDETSENFRESWEIIELFNLGCMDSEAPNYDPFAEFDDGSCLGLVSFETIINGDFDCESSEIYYCDNTTVCPFLNIQGLIVDYFDVTPFGGPHSITLEDPTLYQIELTIWPSEWDIVNDSLAFILSPPYNQILIQASGGIFDFNGNKLMRICSSDNIVIVDFLGCTDPEATNYNPDVTIDDGSCEYLDIEAILSFGEIDLASQTIAIHLENSAPVSGFQFLLSSADSVNFVDVYGGSAEENGFTVELGGNNIVLGFSLSATEIPTGSDVLTLVEFDGFTSNEICLSEGVITSGYEDAQYLDVSYGDCISLYSKGDVNMDGVLDVLDIVTIVNIIFETIDPDDYQLWASDYNSDGDINIMDIVQIVNAIFADEVIIEGCMDDAACNYDESANVDDGSCSSAETNYDCDGNCLIEVDCAGVCGGSAEIDECGECGGDGSSCSYPAYGEINFSVIDMAPIVGAGIYEYPLSAYVEDINSNPVSDSIAVYFQIRENAAPWNNLLNYNYNDKVSWFDGEATVLDSVVYTCIDNVDNCSAGITPDTDGSWLPSVHLAEIVGHGETGMASPFDGNSYPGVVFSNILFGSNSIGSEVIVFASIINSDSSVFIIDSRTNHSGNGIVFPCYECSISLIALPTQWDFSQPPFDVNTDTDFQDVTVSATVTDYFQFPVFNAEIVLNAPQANFVYVCGGEDTDLDGTTGDCTLVADETTTLPLVQDCWTCVENYAPDYAWIIEDSDGNDIADTDGTLMLTPDDIPNYARTSSTGVAAWTIRYSEGVNIPQGTDPVTYQTFNTTITVSLITPSTNNPSETVTLIISKSEED